MDAVTICAGVGYGAVLVALVAGGLRRSGARSLGPANAVTLARAVLVGVVLALVVDGVGGDPNTFWIVTVSVAALALDGVDGAVARRTGTSSAFGARFDMEVDAFLILVLSALCAASFGAWVLAIGGMRYAFVAAARALPWLTAPLAPRYSRKVVAAVQGIVLVCAASGVFPRAIALLALLAALGALCWSFGTDVRWLAARRSPARVLVTRTP